jgi:hypothetical protein
MYGKPSILPRTAPIAVLEGSPDTCFVLSELLSITYCNAAWDRFARENGGGPEVLASSIIPRNLLDFVNADLKKYYADLFAQARALGRPVSHDYECSSASVFRLYRMQIYPLERGQGFFVTNSLRVERPHDRVALKPDNAIYIHSDGLIRMCANCRRTSRAADPAAWDWVPAYVGPLEKRVSHGVCPMCLEFYYRPMTAKPAA